MEIHFAPLQGYTDHHYRRIHNELYGGVDYYYTPFIRVEKGEPRRQDIARLRASAGDGTRIVPQIIFRSVEEFSILTEAIKAEGYARIDLNLGCPYPMQTAKGRGAALIGNIDLMSQIVRLISDDSSTRYSIKMRLGMTDTSEWQSLMPILNSVELEHITLHPKVAKEMYEGELHPDTFARFVSQSTNRVIWNGELHSRADIDRILATYPAIKGVMIGRGLLARPSLAAEWLEGADWSAEKRIASLLDMHGQLLDIYDNTLCGQTQILQKIKPFWDYLEPMLTNDSWLGPLEGHKAYKTIRKATSLDKYRTAVAKIDR